jgi:Cu-Zn family superoxide dismutase
MRTLLFATLVSFSAFAAGTVTVDLKNAHGQPAGTAQLTQVEKGVEVKLDLHGLTPGHHGIHFHETAKCDGPDFKSAGAHLNPMRKEHGLENPSGPHEGDMPNVESDSNGNVKSTVTAPAAKLDDLTKSGAALVLHAKADDQKTNPAGDSGDRIVCGVIAKK